MYSGPSGEIYVVRRSDRVEGFGLCRFVLIFGKRERHRLLWKYKASLIRKAYWSLCNSLTVRSVRVLSWDVWKRGVQFEADFICSLPIQPHSCLFTVTYITITGTLGLFVDSLLANDRSPNAITAEFMPENTIILSKDSTTTCQRTGQLRNTPYKTQPYIYLTEFWFAEVPLLDMKAKCGCIRAQEQCHSHEKSSRRWRI